MSYQVPFGFGGKVFMGIQVFYVDPLVMPIPAIESYNRIAVPVYRVI